MNQSKAVKRMLCFALSLGICILGAGVNFSSTAMGLDAPDPPGEPALGQSYADDGDTSDTAEPEAQAGLMPTASSEAFPQFVDHPDWIEITSAQSTELYNQNTPFIVLYYRTNCGSSRTKSQWARYWIDLYGIPVYGVEIDKRGGCPSWARSKISGGASSVLLPVMTFVIDKDHVSSYTGRESYDDMLAAAKTVADAIKGTSQQTVYWDGSSDVPANSEVVINKRLTQAGNTTVGNGSIVRLTEGGALTVKGRLQMNGTFTGSGVVHVVQGGSISGSGDYSMVRYSLTVVGGVAPGPNAPVTSARAGETVALSPGAVAGKQFTQWQVTQGNGTVDGNLLTMGTSPVTVAAVYGDSPHTLTIGTAPGGSVDKGSENIAAGQQVCITATAYDGYAFKEWSVSGISLQDEAMNPLLFYMPTWAVSVTPVFTETPRGEPESPQEPQDPSDPVDLSDPEDEPGSGAEGEDPGNSPGGTDGGGVSGNNPGGSSGSDSSGGGNGGSSGGGTSASAAQRVSQHDADHALDIALADAKAAGSSTAEMTLTGNYSEISLSRLRALEEKSAATGMNLKIKIRRRGIGGIASQITFDPGMATKDISLLISPDSNEAAKAAALFRKWYRNRLTAISTGQAGSYGMPVRIAVKVDLTGFNTSNLAFYSYNPKDNLFQRIDTPQHQLDNHGYLHFSTDLADIIVISEDALVK